MKTRYITRIVASVLLAAGLVPLGSAQSAFGPAQEGIEVITVTGKRPAQDAIEVITVTARRPAQSGFAGNEPRPIPEGVEVITVVAKRPEPTVASTCVNEVLAAGYASREGARQAIRDCIEHAQVSAAQS